MGLVLNLGLEIGQKKLWNLNKNEEKEKEKNV